MFANNHYLNLFRFVLMLCFSFVVTSCAHNYSHPDSIVLQKPEAGQALIYFFRSPHDSGSLTIKASGKRLAQLPTETYVALSLPPGHYRFLTTSEGLFGSKEAAEPLEVSLKANERVFYYISGTDEKQIGLVGIINLKGAGAVPLLGQESVVKNRIWKECTELDARGFITISRTVKPDI